MTINRVLSQRESASKLSEENKNSLIDINEIIQRFFQSNAFCQNLSELANIKAGKESKSVADIRLLL
jgi:hypothetical protein